MDHYRLLCVLSACLWFAEASPEQDIISWVWSNGGMVDFKLGIVDKEGLRGATAERAVKKDQIVAHLPAQLAVVLGPKGIPSEEHCLLLLRLRKDNPIWNESMAPYWGSFPPIGSSLTKHTYPLKHLDLLQDNMLASAIRVQKAYTRDIFDGAKPGKIEDFQAEFPHVIYEEFAHITSVIASYAFLFPGEDDVPRRTMLPLLDLLNHGDPESRNLEVMRMDNGSFIAYALRDIKQGEHLTFTYSTALQRNDQSLFHYGFVQLHDPPKMAARDFPDGNFYDTPEYSDEDYSRGGALVSRSELVRLESILQQLPTTADEDAQLLAGAGGVAGWYNRSTTGGARLDGPLERMFVRYRMQRKRALSRAIASLRDALSVSSAEL